MNSTTTHSRAERKLADHGYKLQRLDERGRFLARFSHAERIIEVQVKTRIGIYRKYEGENIHLCFPINKHGDERWYLIPHDKLIEIVRELTPWTDTYSWEVRGIYHSANPSRRVIDEIAEFEIR